MCSIVSITPGSGKVHDSCIITGLKKGGAFITATITDNKGKEYTAQCQVIVDGSENDESGYDLKLDSYDKTLEIGDSDYLYLTYGNYGGCEEVPVTWTSSDNSIVSIKVPGGKLHDFCTVNALKAGEVTITASITGSDGKPYTIDCVVTVKGDSGNNQEENSEGYDISLSSDSISIIKSEKESIIFNYGSFNELASVEWTTDDENIISISPASGRLHDSCEITGLSEGTTILTGTITDKSGKEYSAKCQVTVVSNGSSNENTENKVPVKCSISGNEPLNEGENIFLCFESNTEEKSIVEWTVEDPSIISLEVLGKYQTDCNITGLKAGTSKVTGTIKINGISYSASTTITVSKVETTYTDYGIDVESVNLWLGDDEIETGFYFGDLPESTVTWTVKDSSIAKITMTSEDSCYMIGLKEGKTILTATVVIDGKTYTSTCPIYVYKD